MKSVTNNSLLITIISFLKVTNSVQLFPLVGVPNDLFDRYSQETFTCLDGSKTISKWDINDDYCDCPDGSDEPGTAACDFTFFCENRGYKSGKILSSRVNDGICDPECCDGSDEYDGKILCKDVCEEVAKNETKALKEKQKVVDQGLKVKNKYISHFKTWKVETESKIKEIQAKFDELEKKANELKTIKEEKEKLEEVLNKQDEDARQKNRINELDDKVTALEGIIEEQKKNIDHLLDVLKDLKEHHNQNYHDMAVKGAITSYDEFSGSYKPVDIWTDPRVNPTTTTDSSSQATASGDDSEASKIRQGSYFSNFIKGQINSVQKFIDRVFSSQFPIDASSARSDYWNLDSERNDAKRELDDLNTKLNRDMGPDGEYSALSDKCFELDNGEYVYSVCMFGEANQKSNKNYDSVSLGHFSEWVGADYSAQLYSNGTPCWNGPSRSVKLNLICGTEEKVTSVTEPSKCEYHISMLTPAACKPLGVSKPDVYDEDSEL